MDILQLSSISWGLAAHLAAFTGADVRGRSLPIFRRLKS
jgi:hypothetical protein